MAVSKSVWCISGTVGFPGHETLAYFMGIDIEAIRVTSEFGSDFNLDNLRFAPTPGA